VLQSVVTNARERLEKAGSSAMTTPRESDEEVGAGACDDDDDEASSSRMADDDNEWYQVSYYHLHFTLDQPSPSGLTLNN